MPATRRATLLGGVGGRRTTRKLALRKLRAGEGVLREDSVPAWMSDQTSVFIFRRCHPITINLHIIIQSNPVLITRHITHDSAEPTANRIGL